VAERKINRRAEGERDTFFSFVKREGGHLRLRKEGELC
jgi:hypothetical protein